MLKSGDILTVKLIEEVEKDIWIVSQRGELFQVKNTTDIPFKKHQLIDVSVTQAQPLQLKVLGRNGHFSRFDRVI